MALAAVTGFVKSLLPGLRNLGSMAARGGRSSVQAFRHANNAGVGARLRTAANAGRTGITRNWNQLGPAGQTAARNAGITLGAGVGLAAVNNARQA